MLPVLIDAAAALGRRMRDAVADLAPIVGVIAFFQLVVLRAPFPNLAEVAVGMLCTHTRRTPHLIGLYGNSADCHSSALLYARPAPAPDGPSAS